MYLYKIYNLNMEVNQKARSEGLHGALVAQLAHSLTDLLARTASLWWPFCCSDNSYWDLYLHSP